MLWSYGGDVFEDLGNPTSSNVSIGRDSTRVALVAYQKLRKASPQGAGDFDWPEMTGAFSRGDCAMQLNWPAAIKNLDAEIPRGSDGKRQWTVSLPPNQARSTSMAGNWLLGVPQTSKNKKAAIETITLLLDRQREAVLLGCPPTRQSLFAELGGSDDLFYLPVLNQALSNSTARPRTPKWNQVEDAISIEVSSFLNDGQAATVAANKMQSAIAKIMQP